MYKCHSLPHPRVIQEVQDLRVQKVFQEKWGTLALQETVAPVEPEVIQDLQDAEVRCSTLDCLHFVSGLASSEDLVGLILAQEFLLVLFRYSVGT